MARTASILLGVLVLPSAVCLAGTIWHYTCENPDCKLEGDLRIGGGFASGQVTGYCTACKEFVSITWTPRGLSSKWKALADSSGLPSEPPMKLGTVWNPATGCCASIYSCPKCGKPFMEIRNTDLTGVPSAVLDAAEATMERSRQGDKPEDGLRRVTTVLLEFVESHKIICPKCAKPALAVRHRGSYD
jgi:hypothetical protein